MAERTETVIIETEIDVDSSVESINQLRAANKELTAERNKLNIATEEGRKRAAEINVQIDANTNKIKANSSSLEKQRFNVGNYTASIVEASKQIKALEEENKKLAVAIRTVDKSTEEGRDQYNQLNQAIQNNITQINVYNSTIDKTTSSADKTAASFKQLAPGLSGAATGFVGMTRAALAFIATPIGAVVAALGLAIGALTKYFQGSEEGQNRLNKIVAIGSAIFEQFLNVVEAVGEAVFNAISNPKQALIDFGNLLKDQIVNRFVGLLELIPNIGRAVGLLFEGKFVEAGTVALDAVAKVSLGVEGATAKITDLITETGKLIEVGISNGERIAAIEAQIDKDERKLIEDRAKFNLRIAKLREQAVTLEGEARRNAVRQAIALEEQLTNREVQLAQLRLDLAELNIEANGDDKNSLNAAAEARANLTNAEATAYDNTLKFKKQLQSVDEEITKGLEEQAAQERAIRRAQNIESTEVENPLVNAFQTQANLVGDIDKRMKEEGKARTQEYNQFQIDQAKKTAAVEIEVEKSKTQIIGGLIGSLANLAAEDSVAHKALASAQALINTYLAATAALASGSEINPVFGILAAATAVANGLAAVARINGVEFAEGGYTGPGPKHKPAGTVHAGEVVWNQEDVKSVGGPAIANAMRPTAKRLKAPSYGRYADGGVVTTGISQPINQQLELLNIVKNMPTPEVSVVEIAKVDRRVKVKQKISKR